MAFTITLGWWLIPLVLTVALGWQFFREPDPFVGAFFALAGVAAISFVWMVYFGIMLALT